MADKIRWDSAAVDACITKYTEARTRLEAAYAGYTSAAQALSGSWLGNAATSFVDKFTQITNHCNTAFARTDDAIAELKAVNATFEAGESTQKGTWDSASSGKADNPFKA